MWATFTSDLKEFASGAAEETTAVASKVGVKIGGDGDNSGLDGGGYTSSNSSSGGQQQRGGGGGADGSVLLANAAFSMGEKGLKGLSSVGSMMGGIIAPRNDAAAVAMTNNSNSSASSFASNKPSSALTSMLAAEDDDEEEEELGWDDDDDDLDMDSGDDDDEGGDKTKADGDDFFAEQLGDGQDKSSSTKTATAPTSSVDEQVLNALQSKLDTVEKARAELQNEHRMQTAELVELRSKVEELEQQHPTTAVDNAGEGGGKEEVQALQEEIDRLKAQLDGQSKDVSKEHGNEVTALIQEKEDLERELSSQKEQNDQLLQQNQTDTAKQVSEDDGDNNPSSEEQELLLQKYQDQIKDLTSVLETLQSNLDSVKEHSTHQDATHQGAMQEQQLQSAQSTRDLEQSLSQMEESHALAVEEAEEAKAKLVYMEKEVQIAKKEMADQAVRFEERLQGEIGRVKAQGTAADDVAPEAASLVEEREKEALDDTSLKTPNNTDVLQEEKASSDSSSPVLVQEEKESSDIGPPVKLDSNEEEELSDDWGDADSGEW